MDKKRMGFAVIGTNDEARRFLQASELYEKLEFVAVYEERMEEAEAFAREYGAKWHTDDLFWLTAAEEVRGVCLAGEEAVRFDRAYFLLTHKKHVFCESVGCDDREWEYLVEIAEENSVVCLDGSRLAFQRNSQNIQSAFPELGTIYHARFQHCRHGGNEMQERSAQTGETAGKRQLESLRESCICPMVTWFGTPKRMVSEVMLPENGGEGAEWIRAEYETMRVEILYSNTSGIHVPNKIQGEDGYILFRDITRLSDAILYDSNGKKIKLLSETEEFRRRFELEEWIRQTTC